MLRAKRKNEAGKGESGVLLETGWWTKASVAGRRASRNPKGPSKHIRRYLRGNHRGQSKCQGTESGQCLASSRNQRGDKSEGNYQRPQGTRAGARTAPRRECFFMFLKGYQEECVRAQVWPTQLRTSAVGPSYRKSV